MILEIIKQEWMEGILVVVPTIEAADEFGKKIEDWTGGLAVSFRRCKSLVLHSGENRITEMQSYKSDPLGLKDYDVLVITSARIIIDPYELFLSFRGNTGVRKLVLIDEMINFYPQPFTIPQEIKSIVTFVDHCKTHHGRVGMKLRDDWYLHHYQEIDAMRAAYEASGYKLFKAKDKLACYKTGYIFEHIREHGLDATIQGKIKDFSSQTCVILFDGTGDCIFKDSDPRLLPITGKRYRGLYLQGF